MTDASKAKEGEKSNYYFKIIPKEEFPKFMERLKVALDKTDNKKGDKKTLDFEVRGSKEDLNGPALEIFTFDKTKYAEFFDVEHENFKNVLYCASLNLNVKDESEVERLRFTFEQFKPMISAIPKLQNKFEILFRNKGKKVSFDIVAKEGKLVKALIDLGVDISEYHKFNFALKSGINLSEIFDPKADQASNIIKICSVIFSIKSESDNVRYLSGALAEALKEVKLNDVEIQKKFDKCVGYLNFVNSFVGAKLNVEYDAKVLAGEGKKEAEKMSGGAEALKTKITGTQTAILGMIQGLIVPMVFNFQMVDTVKSIDLDTISISLGVPKHQNGCAISIKIPGLTQVLDGILEEEKRKQEEQEKKRKQEEEKRKQEELEKKRKKEEEEKLKKEQEEKLKKEQEEKLKKEQEEKQEQKQEQEQQQQPQEEGK